MSGGGGDSGFDSELRLYHVMFTDIEGSTPRWERDPDGMRILVREHDELLGRLVDGAGGRVLKRTGDGLAATFGTAAEAVSCAVSIQRSMEGIRADPPLTVRIGVHSGLLEARLGDLHGPPMNRAARIMGCAHGGQIVVSAAIRHDTGGGRGDGSGDGASPGVAGVGFRPLGFHRLRGLTKPEELFQVVAAGLREAFPPISSLNTSTGWLPDVASTIIGREAEIDTVLASVDEHTLVSLVGPSGVGKTRLALHCAAQMRSSFPDGAWFVDLAGVTDGEQVIPTIAAAIRLERGAGQDLTDRLRERFATGFLLVLLDNCEHLHAAVVDAVGLLRGAGAATTFLCTTQRRLGLPGEAVLSVDPLPLSPGTGADPSVPSPAVALFLERARTVGFTAGDHDRPAIDTICRELDGLPLAIELAASRCAVLAPAEIADRLDDRFALLRRRDGVERHQTLANAIGWSYDLLRPAEQRLLRSLSIFQGTFDVGAAVEVAPDAGGGLLDDLTELVHRSLVARTVDGFQLLDSVRRFAAAKRAAAGEDAAVHASHAGWIERLVTTPVDGPDVDAVAAALRRLTVLRNDIRLGLATLLEIDGERAARAALGLVDFWTARDLGDEAIEWMAQAVERLDDAALRTELLGFMAAFGWLDGRNEDAASWAKGAIAIAADHGIEFPTVAGARLAVHLAFSGETERARQLADECLDALAEDDLHRPRLLGVLAVVLAVVGEMVAAIDLADEAIRLSRKAGVIRLTTALANRVIITHGQPDTLPIAVELADLSERLGRAAGRAQALLAIALCERTAGNIGEFLRRLVEAAEVMHSTNQRTALSMTLDFVPSTIAAADPLGAAAMLGALERSHAGIAQRGMDATVAELGQLGTRLREQLGPDAFDSVYQEGAALSSDGAIDLLRWISQNWASRAESVRA